MPESREYLEKDLSEVSNAALGFFHRLLPHLESTSEGKLPGWIILSIEELAKEHRTSTQAIYCYIAELREHNIIRQGHLGYYCPQIVCQKLTSKIQ